jgi:hypothetical protein
VSGSAAKIFIGGELMFAARTCLVSRVECAERKTREKTLVARATGVRIKNTVKSETVLNMENLGGVISSGI